MPEGTDNGTIQQAAHEIQRYLSDEIAPMMAADEFQPFVAAPPEILARVVAAWLGTQYRRPGGDVPLADLVYHSLNKLHALAEFGFVEPDRMMRTLGAVGRILAGAVPEADRDELRVRLSRLGEGETVLASRASYLLHREAHNRGADPARRGTASPGAATAPALPALSDQVDRGVRTLNVLLERLSALRLPELPAAPVADGVASSKAAPGFSVGALPQGAGGVDPAMLAQVLTTAALQASSPDQLDAHLAAVRERGVPASMDQVFRTLGRSLPGWTLREQDGEESVPAPVRKPVEAMHRIVSLGRNPEEKARRWGDMTYAAIEQFNEGRLAQAVCILEAAKRLIGETRPDPSIVGQVLEQAQAALSDNVLRRLVEVPEKHGLLRRVLEVFPAYRPEGLLASLEGEVRRERRKLLLALLECHGVASRDLALARLAKCLEGTPPDEQGYFLRNLAYLLRRIPRTGNDDDPQQEIALLEAMIARGQPAMSAKEAIGALGQLATPSTERVLVTRLRALEREAGSVVPREEAWELMDRICASLVRRASRESIREVARHAFDPDPAQGDVVARFAHLSRVDLSVDGEQLEVLLRAIRDQLPRKVLGLRVKRSTPELEGLVLAVSGTPAEDVRTVLREVAKAFEGERFGDQTQTLLAKLEPRARAAAANEALSGDLELFALPNLLQSLTQAQSSGELVLFDRSHARVASLVLAAGRLMRCESGPLRGAEALYRVFEKPAPGTFVFRAIAEAAVPPADGEPLDAFEVMLEGLRRYDEYQQARALAPDGIALEAGRAAATSPEDEADEALTRSVWTRASAGTPPEVCEAETPTDPFRVRRLYAWWLEQGALRPRVAA